MVIRNLKLEYDRNILLGFILSLGLTIIVFYVYPYPSQQKETTVIFSEKIITVLDIPPTNQESAPQMTARAQPKPILPTLINEVDEIILDDVEFEDNSLSSTENIGDQDRTSSGEGDPRVLTSLPFAPRQILWVVPNKEDDIDGFITFSLKIGINGMVKEHRIVENTIENSQFIDKVISSLYKCKWAPVVMEGEKVEFWIELTYQ